MDMKALLDEIIETNYKADFFFFKKPVRAKPRKPASDADLERLDAFLASRGLKAPASYRTCLAIYNGIDGFLGADYPLLSINKVIARTKKLSTTYDQEYPNLVQFVIGEGPMNWMAFDVTTSAAKQGYEMGEVTVEGKGWRYKSFDKFLAEYLATVKKTIRQLAHADR